MISKTFASAVVALAASGLVSAQTFTDCNPLEKSMFSPFGLSSSIGTIPVLQVD